MKKVYFLISLFIVLLSESNAQKLITADEAVSIVLKNNFGILIAFNDADIARINNTAGNAGMLPNIAITGSDDYSINTVNKKLPDGSEVKSSDVRTNSFNAAAVLNWTLYDGGKMFVTKSKLNEIQALGELQYKEKVLQTIYDVIIAYYEIVKQNQELTSIHDITLFNEERVKIYQTSFSSGLSPKTNLLQAKIDLNVNYENALTQKHIINAAKRNLNQLLCRNIDSTSFDVLDSIPLNYSPDRNEILQKLQSNNTAILMYQKQVAINSYSLKEYNSNRLPKINFNAGYNFLRTDYNKGDYLNNRLYGPQIGASLSIPIFQAGNINRQVSIAKIELNSAKYALENVKIEMNTELLNALADFENQKSLLNIEQENAVLAKENLEISMQRLRFGQTTSLEVRQAQESYQDSKTRLINFKYNLKVAETKLKQLIAEL
jgi:outer membrane protein